VTIRTILPALLLTAATLTAAPAAATATGGPAAAARAGAHAGSAACTATGSGSDRDFDGDGTDDVAVGDPFADGDKGAAYVISGEKVIPVSVPGLAQGDAFGWSVRLAKVDGDACADLVVGAPYTDVRGNEDAGAVYVVYGGGQDPKQLVAIEPQRDAHFGWSLATKADLVVIGAPYEDEKELADTGAVYVRKGDGPLRRISQESETVPGNGEVGDQFGWSLAMGPDNGLIVGVPYENDDGAGRQVGAGKIDSGSVVSIKDVLAPALEGVKLDSPTAASGDRYGYAVAYVEGAGLAVSSPGPGYVQLLDTALKPVRTVRQGGKQAFGFALAASTDGRLAIGAPYGGGVRLISFGDGADDRPVEPVDGLFGHALAFAGNRLFVGLPDAEPYGKVAIVGRNSDDMRLLQSPKGADFGMSLG
jgi:hypothetical protein